MRPTRANPTIVSDTFDLRSSQAIMFPNIYAGFIMVLGVAFSTAKSDFPSPLDTGRFPRYSHRLDHRNLREPGSDIQEPERPDFVPQRAVHAVHHRGNDF